MPLMTCPRCRATIPIGPLSAKCNACGFDSATATHDDIAKALKRSSRAHLRAAAPRSTSMIVKVQISIHTSEPERQVLVMNKSRSYVSVLPLSACPGLEDVMLDTAPVWRAFFEAELVNDKIHIGQRLPDQDW